MAKGITYFLTDTQGNVYTRYSAKHTEAAYPFACVTRPEGTTHAVGKHDVTYSGRLDLAQANQRRLHGFVGYRGRLVSEIVTVRAYPGKHTTEPQA